MKIKFSKYRVTPLFIAPKMLLIVVQPGVIVFEFLQYLIQLYYFVTYMAERLKFRKIKILIKGMFFVENVEKQFSDH